MIVVAAPANDTYQYLNLGEGAVCLTGQLYGHKECPFSGVTKSGRVWRKVLESHAQCVTVLMRLVLHVYLHSASAACVPTPSSQLSAPCD